MIATDAVASEGPTEARKKKHLKDFEKVYHSQCLNKAKRYIQHACKSNIEPHPRRYLAGVAIVKTFEKANSTIRPHILCEFPWLNIVKWRTREVEETLGHHEYMLKPLTSQKCNTLAYRFCWWSVTSRTLNLRWLIRTKHFLGWNTLAGMENTCTGDKTLTQIENNSTNTNTFINHYTFSQIWNTPTNHKTLAHKALKPGY